MAKSTAQKTAAPTPEEAADAAASGPAVPPVVPDAEVPAQVTAAEQGTPPAAARLFAPVLRVKGPAKGRWRAGRHFGPDEQILTEADITAEQVAMIMADPELTAVLDEAIVA